MEREVRLIGGYRIDDDDCPEALCDSIRETIRQTFWRLPRRRELLDIARRRLVVEGGRDA